MVITVCYRIDLKGQLEFAIALKPETFIIAREGLDRIARRRFGGIAFGLLLYALTSASNEELILARLIFFA